MFDFGGGNAEDARTCLTAALAGDLQAIAGDDHPSVTLNQGVLTHGVRRRSTVELTLPFYKESEVHVNEVLSTIKEIDHGQGRLLAVQDVNTVSILKGRNRRESSLTVALTLNAAGQTGVVVHEQPAAACSYSLTDQFDGLSMAGLLARYKPDISTYFGGEFGQVDGRGNVEEWAEQLNGGANLAAGSCALELTVPPAVVLGWMKAPAEKRAPVYKAMAATLVRKFRDLLLQQFFANLKNFDLVAAGSPTFILLSYSSVPILNNARLDGGGRLLLQQDNGASNLFWDTEDVELRAAMLSCAPAKELLNARLEAVRAILTAEGSDKVGFYGADQADGIIQTAINDTVRTPLLFATEAALVENARAAGMAIGKFLASPGAQADVQGPLEAFAAKLTDTFQGGLKTWATDSLLLPLGPALLTAAAQVFAADDGAIQPSAMFTVQASNLSLPQRLTSIALPAVRRVGT